MPFKVERVWAYIVVGEDDEEGICLIESPEGVFLMVSATEEGGKALRPFAQDIARQSGAKITLACFDVRADIEEITEK